MGTGYGTQSEYTNPVDKDLITVKCSSNHKESSQEKSLLGRTKTVIPRVSTESKQNVCFRIFFHVFILFLFIAMDRI